VLEIAAGRRRTVRIAPLGRDRSRLLSFTPMPHGGTVELEVLEGIVGVDGVALER
jgi:hypothetical protein